MGHDLQHGARPNPLTTAPHLTNRRGPAQPQTPPRADTHHRRAPRFDVPTPRSPRPAAPITNNTPTRPPRRTPIGGLRLRVHARSGTAAARRSKNAEGRGCTSSPPPRKISSEALPNSTGWASYSAPELRSRRPVRQLPRTSIETGALSFMATAVPTRTHPVHLRSLTPPQRGPMVMVTNDEEPETSTPPVPVRSSPAADRHGASSTVRADEVTDLDHPHRRRVIVDTPLRRGRWPPIGRTGY